MAITSAQMSTLLTGSSTAHKNQISDLVTGKATDITTALFASQLTNTGLSSRQSDAVSNLRDYVKNNVKGDDSKKLLADLDAIEALMTNGNENADNSNDPVYTLLAGSSGQRSNADLLKSLPTGSLVDQLL